MTAKPKRCGAHRYRRYVNRNGISCWKCLKCPHYLYGAAQVVGRRASCGVCGRDFDVAPANLLRSGYDGQAEGGGTLNQPVEWRGWRVDIVCGQCEENLAETKEALLEEQRKLSSQLKSAQTSEIRGIVELAYREVGEKVSLVDLQRASVAKAICSDSEQQTVSLETLIESTKD